jgi:DNA-binding NarL/FixJ family response regulator
MTTTVLIADNHAKVRQAWLRLLLALPDVTVVAEARDGEEAVSLALQYQPSLVLMDISMPRMDGFEATRRICLNAPEVRVIMVSADTSPICVDRAFEVGANGYVTKINAADELPQAVQAVAQGGQFRTPLAESTLSLSRARVDFGRDSLRRRPGRHLRPNIAS